MGLILAFLSDLAYVLRGESLGNGINLGNSEVRDNFR